MTEPQTTRAKPRLQLRLNWKLVVFALLFLPLLTGLGFWQLQRAEEKSTIQESWRKQQAMPAVAWHTLAEGGRTADIDSNLSDADFRRVSIQGTFLAEHYWLLENRVLDGKLGYEVLMAFVPSADSAAAIPSVVVVNRGWQPAGAYRSQLPEVDTPAGALRISGSLVEPSDNRLVEESGERPETWPRPILEVDLTAMQQQLRAEGVAVDVYPQLLQIDAESRGAFHTNWQPINMTPATHHGYAVQWFSLAGALLILTLIANTNIIDVLFRRNRTRRNDT